MKIDIEKVKAWNSKLYNDFKIDLAMLQFYNTKDVHKIIMLEDGNKLEVSLAFRECGLYKRQVELILHLQVWNKTTISEDMFISAGSYRETIKEPQDKKNFKDIIECTKVYDTETCLKLMKEKIENVETPFSA
jgi:hypothetical protein